MQGSLSDKSRCSHQKSEHRIEDNVESVINADIEKCEIKESDENTDEEKTRSNEENENDSKRPITTTGCRITAASQISVTR